VRCPGLTNPCSAHTARLPRRRLQLLLRLRWRRLRNAVPCFRQPLHRPRRAGITSACMQLRHWVLRRARTPESSCFSCQRAPAYAPGGAATPRSGRGLRSQGIGGDGKCVCAFGCTGPARDAICAGGLVSPCQGHGTCDAATNCPQLRSILRSGGLQRPSWSRRSTQGVAGPPARASPAARTSPNASASPGT
jgi:hypothetical protein